MPVGDSITDGKYQSTNEWGYRGPLWFKLKDIPGQIDFVGSCHSGLRKDFDADHEGHPGFTPKQVAENIHDWLIKNPADFILLHIGTNDLKHPEDVEQILNKIDLYEEQQYRKIPVLLALIINSKNYNPKITEFNNQIEAMAKKRIEGGDRIFIVDMESALDYSQDIYEDNHQSLHPNDRGYEKMAEVWYDAFKKTYFLVKDI